MVACCVLAGLGMGLENVFLTAERVWCELFIWKPWLVVSCKAISFSLRAQPPDLPTGDGTRVAAPVAGAKEKLLQRSATAVPDRPALRYLRLSESVDDNFNVFRRLRQAARPREVLGPWVTCLSGGDAGDQRPGLGE